MEGTYRCRCRCRCRRPQATYGEDFIQDVPGACVQGAEKISFKAPPGADACVQRAQKISFKAPPGADACVQRAEKISFKAPPGADAGGVEQTQRG